MNHFLITNDDGIDSPMLVPLARAVSRLGSIRVVVPESERSWVAKAITRFDPVGVDRRERDGIPMYAVSGTPADCVSLGVHTLGGGDPPHAVVSGINLGLNYGLAFLLSSGTVGGALEAWIAGVPAIAFSMAIPQDAFGLTGAHRSAALGGRPPLAAAVAADILESILDSGAGRAADLISVNLPADVDMQTPRVVTRLTRCRYGPLFVPGPDGGYLHRFQKLLPLESPVDGDIEVVGRGAVSINPLRLDLSADLAEPLRRRLERR